MEFDCWEPVYERILKSFGYSRAGDERAGDSYAMLLAGEQVFDHTTLDFTGQTVAIAGGAASLETDLDLVDTADAIVAASDAAGRLRDQSYTIDCMVTDLDKTPETACKLTTEGTPVAVHAHGDNNALIEQYLPEMNTTYVIPTTQAKPVGPICNFGGFTDGDRAAFLADVAGAKQLHFLGWDFDDPSVSEKKREKLVWAERLLYWLEIRRGERFAVLDGRREGIDTTALPVK